MEQTAVNPHNGDRLDCPIVVKAEVLTEDQSFCNNNTDSYVEQEITGIDTAIVKCEPDDEGYSEYDPSSIQFAEVWPGNSKAENNETRQEDNIFTCEVCQKSYTTNQSFQNHLRHVHPLVSFNKCQICKQNFSARTFLDTHIRLEHTAPDYECNVCSRTFTTRNQIKAHLLTPCKPSSSWSRSYAQPFTYNCSECADLRAKLIGHTHCNHDDLSKRCQACNRCFDQTILEEPDETFQSGRLVEPMYTAVKYVGPGSHPKRKSFQCNICKKFLAYKSSFKRHSRLHTGETSYKCELCKESFLRLSSLQRHREKHPNFTCNYCEKVFFQQSELVKHLQKACVLCRKCFCKPSVMQNHIRSFHNSYEID